MARIATDPNYNSPTFPRATASTDLFLKEDVQALAAAISTHVHDGAGKGLSVVPAAGTVPGSALANGSVTLAKLAADSVDSSKIVDGTIATADLANAAVTNAKLAADTARANLLVNGGLEIWQRGNGPFSTQGAWAADRWQIGLAGTDTLSVTRDTTNVDTASGSKVDAVCTFVLGTGAGATALYSNFNAVTDGLQITNRILSLSVRVRCSTANAMRIGIYTGAAWTYSGFHTGGGAYETLVVTATMAASGALLGQIGVYFAASTTNANIDNAMLVVGSVAADYAPLHPADDLARCQRYYEIIGESPNTVLVGGWATAGGQTGYVSMGWACHKAVAPTVTVVGAWTQLNATAKPALFTGGLDTALFSTVSSAAGVFYSINGAAGVNISAEGNP